MDQEQMLARLGIACVFALVTILAISLFLGAERKSKWFKVRQNKSFFTRRGFVGDSLRFGKPITAEEYFVSFGMSAFVFLGSYLILFYF